MQNSFFHPNDQSKRVALENSVLRERCQSVLNEAANATNVTDEMKQNILQVMPFHVLSICYYKFLYKPLKEKTNLCSLRLSRVFSDYCDKSPPRCNQNY